MSDNNEDDSEENKKMLSSLYGVNFENIEVTNKSKTETHTFSSLKKRAQQNIVEYDQISEIESALSPYNIKFIDNSALKMLKSEIDSFKKKNTRTKSSNNIASATLSPIVSNLNSQCVSPMSKPISPLSQNTPISLFHLNSSTRNSSTRNSSTRNSPTTSCLPSPLNIVQKSHKHS